MKMGEEQMDLIVGVDFGMTCTGVSYSNQSIRSNTIKWIQNWPGRAHANENKVPTALAYPRNATTPESIPSSWGFLPETAAEQNKYHKEWFKTFLDPVRLAAEKDTDPEGSPSMDEVEKWYEDYLQLLYRYIELKLNPELSGTSWHNAKIEFLFSVPTTWKPQTVEKFREITERAGFGRVWSHKVNIGLTEAEAAAVHTSVEAPGIFERGQVILVCDAGGGTTDLSVLRVANTGSEFLSLEQLDVVFGANIGSAAIDYAFERLVKDRLRQAGITEYDDIAWEMMKSSDFQNTKCAHGGPDDIPIFSIRIPKVDPAYINPVVRIRDGHMDFSRTDLQMLFDSQIQDLTRLIDDQLIAMQRNFPNEPIAHLVLSGGLGRSPCIQERLRSHYILGAGSHPNARSMQVRVAPDPQLAVCKGLVADRVSRIRSGVSILKWRRCRASYGTLCREVYNPDNSHHVGRQISKDTVNGKSFVTQSVEWFIKKGEPVSADAIITRDFKRTFAPGDTRRVFPTSIVVSDIDSNLLHPYMSADALVLCEIESDLSSVDGSKMREKKKSFWKPGKHYFQIDYQIKVLIGPADIRFELWFDGQKINKDQPITVEWHAAAPPEPPKLTRGEDILETLQPVQI